MANMKNDEFFVLNGVEQKVGVMPDGNDMDSLLIGQTGHAGKSQEIFSKALKPGYK